MNKVLQIDNLTKIFPRVTALDRINLSIGAPGEILSISGPNGSGKTTFLKCLAGLIKPTCGNIKIYGLDACKASYETKKFVGLSTDQERSFYWRLSGKENLKFFAGLFEMNNRRIIRKIHDLAEAFGVTSWLDLPFSRYSTGIRQRFSLMRALVHEPKLLLLDEPCRSLDESARSKLYNLFGELSGKRNVTIIVTNPENYAAVVENAKKLSIDKGKIRS
jgi:ABC-type multidrug transport system ATPase subunit